MFDAGITELEVNLYIKNIEDKVSKVISEFEDKFLRIDLNILKNKS